MRGIFLQATKTFNQTLPFGNRENPYENYNDPNSSEVHIEWGNGIEK